MKHSFIDKYSDGDSIIHRLDPRIKLIGLVSFILFIILSPPTAFLSFALFAVFICVLIFLSRVPFGFVFKRSLVIIPFVLMIAVFIPFFKKGEIAGGYSFGQFELKLTYEGILILWNCFVKSYLSILCMILLGSTTKFQQLLKALQSLRCPKLIIMILSFMYRYIFVIADELMKMRQAKEARSVGGGAWFHIKTLANMVGVLFMRSYERAENVYLAMTSRGFVGDIHTINNFCLRQKDFIFLLTLLLLLVGIRILGG